MTDTTQTAETQPQHSENVAVMPERRDLHFLPPAERIHDWHYDGPHITQFMNALSLLFPAGERMFIDAVRSYRDDIPDPDLKKAATAFIGQEAMHSREHVEYNNLMDDAGLPATKLADEIWTLLEWVKENTPKSFPLSGTIALEHYTALMGDMLLKYPELMGDSQEDYARMWRWHALEEVEHKAVAYDVYEKCVGRGPQAYAVRSLGMIVATAIFWPVLFNHYRRMTAADENCRKAGWRGHLKVLDFTLGKRGYLRKMVPEFLGYFRYSFHPWQQNNSAFLEELESLADEAEAAYATHH